MVFNTPMGRNFAPWIGVGEGDLPDYPRQVVELERTVEQNSAECPFTLIVDYRYAHAAGSGCARPE
jgi:hypothetical protein